jgi:Fe-S-cluster containining protein
VVVASLPHEELVNAANNGEQSAIEFLELFEPYESYKEAMKVDEAIVKNIPNYENRTFYKCRFLLDNNLCSRYETRLEVCKIFPSSPWAVIPPDCGFEGWIFVEREKHKQRIRKLKEDKIVYQAKLKTEITGKEKNLYKKLIQKIDDRIRLFEKFGANDW